MTYNLARMLDLHRDRRPDAVALRFEERTLTYGELAATVDALAAGLAELGAVAGDRIAILGQNSDLYMITCFATARLGAIFVPLNTRLHADELAYLLDDAEPRLLVVDGELQALAASASGLTTTRPTTIGLYEAVDLPVTVPGLIDAHRSAPRRAAVDVDEHTPQRIMYTSGTTSRPKGAILTHGNVAWNTTAQVLDIGLAADDVVLNFAPMYHVGGLDLPGFATFAVGATMTIMRKFEPRSILETIERDGVTGMVMVATMVHMMRDVDGWDRFDTSSVRWMIFGQVPPALFDETARIFPQARLIDGYGLTETCSGVTYNDRAHARTKLGSVGQPLAHVDIDVVGDDDESLPPGELGEVVARGPKVSPGYWRDDAATAAAIRNGWFHTGDIGYLDDDGYLFVVDRKKDMIRSGGENVASAEIERVLMMHDAVAEAAAVARPDDKWVEVPVAFVALRPGASVDADGLIEHCRARLARFKVPHAIEFLDSLPRNPSGKVLKRDLRQRFGTT